MECDLNCKLCKISPCIYDVVEKHKKRVITERQLAAYDKRKKTLTKRQQEALEIYQKYQVSGDKYSKEYKSAYEVVRYLKDREKRLEAKKERYKRLYLLEES